MTDQTQQTREFYIEQIEGVYFTHEDEDGTMYDVTYPKYNLNQIYEIQDDNTIKAIYDVITYKRPRANDMTNPDYLDKYYINNTQYHLHIGIAFYKILFEIEEEEFNITMLNTCKRAFQFAADKGNGYASYCLGKLYERDCEYKFLKKFPNYKTKDGLDIDFAIGWDETYFNYMLTAIKNDCIDDNAFQEFIDQYDIFAYFYKDHYTHYDIDYVTNLILQDNQIVKILYSVFNIYKNRYCRQYSGQQQVEIQNRLDNLHTKINEKYNAIELRYKLLNWRRAILITNY